MQERNDGASLLNDFAARLLPLLKDGLDAVLPPKSMTSPLDPRTNGLSHAPRMHSAYAGGPQRGSSNSSSPKQRARQQPPPPPDAPAEVFADSPYKHHSARTEEALEMRKKEMQAELDSELKQLDTERKEGLYRLDWELAEAIEALHARHAERANAIVRHHKTVIGEMEKRAQAGQELTPEHIQMLKSPQKAQPLYGDEPFEEDEEESEEESDEEGVFGTVLNFFRGRDEPRPSARSKRYNEEEHLDYEDDYDETGSQYSQYGNEGYELAEPPTQYYPEGAAVPHENGFAGHAHAMQGFEPQPPPPLPKLPPMSTADLSPTNPMFAGSFNGPPSSSSMQVARTSSMQTGMWPPANVYHGGPMRR